MKFIPAPGKNLSYYTPERGKTEVVTISRESLSGKNDFASLVIVNSTSNDLKQLVNTILILKNINKKINN